jgi:hypothetical protein
VRRQQTLRASVDWSYALLAEAERRLFQRLSVFLGGFDLDAAQAVAAGSDVASYEVLDLLALLVDKSLLTAENTTRRTRYRFLETVRQYALEKLSESGEADTVRTRHRDHYLAFAATVAAPSVAGHERRLNQAEVEIDNLRAALVWSRENGDTDHVLGLASSLQPLWRARGRLLEGAAWLDAALADHDAHPGGVDRGLYARTLANRAFLDAHMVITDHLDLAQQALAIARDIDDPMLLARALAACGGVAFYNPDVARPFLAEAVDLARSTGDKWTLAETLAWQGYAAAIGEGDPVATHAAGEEGRDLADELGDSFLSRCNRWFLGSAHLFEGDLDGSVTLLSGVVDEADATYDTLNGWSARVVLAHALAQRGNIDAARAAAQAAVDAAVEVSPGHAGLAYAALAAVNLAAGDIAAAEPASDAATRSFGPSDVASIHDPNVAAQIAYAHGDLDTAWSLADGAVSVSLGGFRAAALTTRCRVAIAQGDLAQAERDAHEVLSFGRACADLCACPRSSRVPRVVSGRYRPPPGSGSAHRCRRRGPTPQRGSPLRNLSASLRLLTGVASKRLGRQ